MSITSSIFYCKFLFFYQNEEVNKKLDIDICKSDQSIAILSSNYISNIFFQQKKFAKEKMRSFSQFLRWSRNFSF